MRRAFTLIELLVVIRIIGLLLAILLPALSAGMAYARTVSCASQMRQMGMGLVAYANENDGSYPRDQTPWRPDRVSWMQVVVQRLGDAGTYAAATAGSELLVDLRLRRLYLAEPILHCPSHPRRGQVPGTYVMNAFDFATSPDWRPVGMTKLARIQDASRIIALAEVSNDFGNDLSDRQPVRRIDWPEFHDVWEPSQTEEGGRLSMRIHREGTVANLLRFDGSAAAYQPEELDLAWFDDGVSSRAGRPVDPNRPD